MKRPTFKATGPPKPVEDRPAEEVLSAEIVPVPSKKSRRAVLATVVATSLDRNPVAVYLARFASKDGRRVQLGALRTMAKAFGGADPFKLPWAEIGYQHVCALRTKLVEQELAPATVNRILSAVRGVCEEAVRLGVLNDHDGQLIAGLKGVRGDRLPAGRHLDAEDLRGLFQGAHDLDNPVIACRDRALLAVLRVAGLRRAELVGLQVDDVDWGSVRRGNFHLDGTWKSIVRGKGNKERQIYLENAAPELKAWLKLRGLDPGPLFSAVHRTGSIQRHALDASSISFIMKRSADLGGVENTSPHDFRRTSIGDLLDAGVDIATVQKFAGHATVTTTARYDRRPARATQEASRFLTVPEPETEEDAEAEEEDT